MMSGEIWLYLAAAIGLHALLGLKVLSVSRTAARALEQAKANEELLLKKNEALTAEVAERKRAEEALRDSEGRLSLIAAESQRNEERVKQSLQEKEVLLREIHHRVKNNLQIIASLLHLQASSAGGSSNADIFRDSQVRVAAMALIHDQLYQSSNFAEINFDTYVRKLITSLFDSYRVQASQIELSLPTGADGVALNITDAVPCALLLNEILSNSLKHAFRDGRRGKIVVSMRREGENYLLRASDDGVGMPTDPRALQSGTLGLRLIEALAEQLNGKMKREGPPGVHYTITFPVDRPR